ncbi:hypothetical protein [Polyangium sp. y55x31]|uniref:hypothetical protein n=1 Tax=Polyangium sp. y55x31 TaxID=3042688 RepID=UPI00248307DC|nr:hypothetical protein [Polyangium sp. y55x31]MDI1479633.1 hypothetical protein [Polyangium sp. y55x31]
MFDLFRKRGGSTPELIHPPWRAGQYVTYYMERGDGVWAAFVLRLLGQTKDGAWIIQGDFKTRAGESTVWFRSEPSAPENEPDPIPVKQTLVRSSQVKADIKDRMADDPLVMVTLAMNLLLVRRWPAALESLRTEPRSVSYPCEIEQAHLLVTDGPGYKKHHDIHPRVMLTGVACLSIDGHRNPMTVTSFGLNDPEADGATSYDDFVDLSYPKRVDHDGFELTYPATWFLRERETESKQVKSYFAMTGGISCSLTLSVKVQEGSVDEIARERDAVVARVSAPIDGSMGRVSPRETMKLPGDAKGFLGVLENRNIDGLSFDGVYVSEDGRRFANVIVFLCVLKQNPRARGTLANYERLAREILASFAFT